MYLKKIYREWRSLFWVVLLLMLAQVFFMFKGIENVPFFLYHMFSGVHPSNEQTKVYLIKIPDGYFDTKELSNREEEMLLNNIEYYNKLSNNGYNDIVNESIAKRFKQRFSQATYQYLQAGLSNDSTAVKKYPDWWKRYFRSVTDEKYDSISVVSSYVSEGFVKSPVDSVLFTIPLRP